MKQKQSIEMGLSPIKPAKKRAHLEPLSPFFIGNPSTSFHYLCNMLKEPISSPLLISPSESRLPDLNSESSSPLLIYPTESRLPDLNPESEIERSEASGHGSSSSSEKGMKHFIDELEPPPANQCKSMPCGPVTKGTGPCRSNAGFKLFGVQLMNEPATHGEEYMTENALKPLIAINGGVRLKRRTCTKVLMQGRAVGRAVDLRKLDGYDDLMYLLEEWFEIGGELSGANKKWVLVYVDHGGKMVVMGGDPWPEFRGMVKKIEIYGCDEAIKMMGDGTVAMFSGFRP
ncbi:auxin response factor 11 [Amborella trichopoda]|uniref:PB1 domain-containing protein n=1 Tax=Amborella trichopoda TaxID=13333 RepID=U5D6T7_AMBTC|nr:auxin response factor 11 [Amborella trichopoda]ERN17122.1 hypothetical protein AMTR_s00044p00116500 [Amborella trichopoda]|eukprot:XP_006855655.1 auxin response factor 11 [Amborella trichopoda]